MNRVPLSDFVVLSSIGILSSIDAVNNFVGFVPIAVCRLVVLRGM